MSFSAFDLDIVWCSERNVFPLFARFLLLHRFRKSLRQQLAVQVDRLNKTGKFYESACSNLLEGFQSKRFYPPGDSLRSRWWFCESVLCTDRPYMLELVDGNVTIWLGGPGGGGYVFWELEPHSCWCTGVGGIVLSLRDSTWESLGRAVGPLFREKRLCVVVWRQTWM